MLKLFKKGIIESLEITKLIKDQKNKENFENDYNNNNIFVDQLQLQSGK